MNAAQTEAIANADAHLNNAGLATYSDLLQTLRVIHFTLEDADDTAISDALRAMLRGDVRRALLQSGAPLSA